MLSMHPYRTAGHCFFSGIRVLCVIVFFKGFEMDLKDLLNDILFPWFIIRQTALQKPFALYKPAAYGIWSILGGKCPETEKCLRHETGKSAPHLSSGWVIPSRREVKNIRTKPAGLPGMVDRSPSKWNPDVYSDDKVRPHTITVFMKKPAEIYGRERLCCPRGLCMPKTFSTDQLVKAYF